jgi:hypothetical protein
MSGVDARGKRSKSVPLASADSLLRELDIQAEKYDALCEDLDTLLRAERLRRRTAWMRTNRPHERAKDGPAR